MQLPGEFRTPALVLFYNAMRGSAQACPVASKFMQYTVLCGCLECAEEKQVSPEAQQFLDNLGATTTEPTDEEIAQTREFVDKVYAGLQYKFENEPVTQALVPQFMMCAAFYLTLEGEECQERAKRAKAAAVKIKALLQKATEASAGAQAGGGGGPPVFTPAGGGGGPPVFTPSGGSGGPPVFTPAGGSGGPPVFTPAGGSGGPPVFTPSSGGPPVFTPAGGSGGPPVFTPAGGGGGPPVFTPSGGGGGPPVFTPSGGGGGPPVFTPAGGGGGPPVFTPGGGDLPTYPGVAPVNTVDPSFDVEGARRKLESMGYKVVATTPTLNDNCRTTIDRYLTSACSRLQGGERDQALMLLQDALKTWKTGKPQ